MFDYSPTQVSRPNHFGPTALHCAASAHTVAGLLWKSSSASLLDRLCCACLCSTLGYTNTLPQRNVCCCLTSHRSHIINLICVFRYTRRFVALAGQVCTVNDAACNSYSAATTLRRACGCVLLCSCSLSSCGSHCAAAPGQRNPSSSSHR